MAEVQPYPSPPPQNLSSIPPSEPTFHGVNDQVNHPAAMPSNTAHTQSTTLSEEQPQVSHEEDDLQQAPSPSREGQPTMESERPTQAPERTLQNDLTDQSQRIGHSGFTDHLSPNTASTTTNNTSVREETETNDVASSEPSQPESATPVVNPSTEEISMPADAPTQSETDRTATSQSTDPESTSDPQGNSDPTPPLPPATAEDSAEPLVDSSEPAPPPPVNTEDTPESPPDTSESAPPPPPEENAYWVDLKEDTSSPDENELKEIEEGGNEVSALDYKWHEDQFYSDLEDPEYRPSKKIRITWIIKGVRGTKERPNMARIMNSPTAEAGGYFWRLKFFPRGNNCRPLSCYIKCSKTKMEDDEVMPETKFHWVEGPGNETLGEAERKGNLSFPATPPKADKPEQPAGDKSAAVETPESANEAAEDQDRDQSGNNKQTDEHDEQHPTDDAGWRVPAQIAVVIYNPDEPRTNHHNSSCHQFNKGNDDWGWTNFMPEAWDEIHTRQRGHQRLALLRGDTLAFDAYIRIFDDPTQRLWFHTSDQETFWDGVSVTGYRAFGTPPLRYSPGVSGLSALLHLAPVRALIQGIQIDEWQKDPAAKQKPLCTATQGVLYLMRRLRKNVSYVDLYPLLNLMADLGEKFYDVLTFWERFRRSIEVDCSDKSVSDGFSAIFDIQSRDPNSPIVRDPLSAQRATLSISCKDVSNVSSGIERLDPSQYEDKILPPFLTVDLGRQQFDYNERAWKLQYNRVKLDEELNLSSLVPHQDQSKYTLYGFVVHSGERTSQHFYTVIRPDGPGTRWLAFEDGDGNKILIQTKKMLQEFEGLEGKKLQENSSTHHTAYLAMYVRTDLVREYLPGRLEPWDPPRRVKLHPTVRNSLNDKDLIEEEKSAESEIKVSIFFSKHIEGRRGFLNADVLRDADDSSTDVITLRVPATTSFFDLRKTLAELLKEENPRKIRFWGLGNFPPLDELSKCVHRITAYDITMDKCSKHGRTYLWAHLLRDDEVESLGFPDPQPKPKKEKRKAQAKADVPPTLDDAHESGTSHSNPGSGSSPTDSSVAHEPTGEPVTADSSVALEPTAEPVTADSSVALEPTAEPVTADSSAESPQESVAATANVQSEAIPVQTSTETQQDAEQTVPHIALPTQPTPVEASVAQPGEHQGLQDNATSQPAADIEGEPVTAIAPQNVATEGDTLAITEDNTLAAAEGDTQNAADSSAQESATNTALEENAEALLNDAAIAEILADDVAALDAAEGQALSAQATTDGLGQEADTQAGGEAENPVGVPPPEPQPDSAITPPVNEENNDDAASVHTDASTESDAEPAVEPHTYRFLQVFDAHQQEIRTVGSLIAKKDSSIKDTIRTILDYSVDKAFQMWYLDFPYRTKSIASDAKFEDTDPRHDSCVILVGDALSDAEKSALHDAGKFSTPRSMLNNHWLRSRGHPSADYTGEIETATFGRHFYKGSMLNGRFHGEGTHINNTGHQYTGTFLQDHRSGQGKLVSPNGDVYEGGFKKNERHGEGTFVEKRTGNRYVGGFKEDKRSGKGITYWEVAQEDEQLCQICYGEAQDALFYDCGHVCACLECARQVDTCPICRKVVKGVVRIFWT